MFWHKKPLQEIKTNCVDSMKAFISQVAYCDDQNCGALFRKRSLQVVSYHSPFSSQILHFCSKHRRPYDKIESIPGKEIHYYKDQEPLVEVTEKGKPIKSSKKK